MLTCLKSASPPGLTEGTVSSSIEGRQLEHMVCVAGQVLQSHAGFRPEENLNSLRFILIVHLPVKNLQATKRMNKRNWLASAKCLDHKIKRKHPAAARERNISCSRSRQVVLGRWWDKMRTRIAHRPSIHWIHPVYIGKWYWVHESESGNIEFNGPIRTKVEFHGWTIQNVNQVTGK